jgi:hypothetical protein
VTSAFLRMDSATNNLAAVAVRIGPLVERVPAHPGDRARRACLTAPAPGMSLRSWVELAAPKRFLLLGCSTARRGE